MTTSERDHDCRRRYRCVACRAEKFIGVACDDTDRDIRTGCASCGTIVTHEPVGAKGLSYYRRGDERGGSP